MVARDDARVRRLLKARIVARRGVWFWQRWPPYPTLFQFGLHKVSTKLEEDEPRSRGAYLPELCEVLRLDLTVVAEIFRLDRQPKDYQDLNDLDFRREPDWSRFAQLVGKTIHFVEELPVESKVRASYFPDGRVESHGGS